MTRRPLAQVVQDYKIYVQRNEGMTNEEIAQALEMTKAGLERALHRARQKGLLDIRRVAICERGRKQHIRIARYGETQGFPARLY